METVAKVNLYSVQILLTIYIRNNGITRKFKINSIEEFSKKNSSLSKKQDTLTQNSSQIESTQNYYNDDFKCIDGTIHIKLCIGSYCEWISTGESCEILK